MAGNTNHNGPALTESERQRANKFIARYLQGVMADGRNELVELRKKLSFTYWVIIGLSIIMFGLGVTLLSVPFLAAVGGKIDVLTTLIAAGFGLADLASLFLFRPMERIHQLMGDMSQVTLALNSFQTQVGLRLRQMDAEDRRTIGRAADFVQVAARDSIGLVERYFEDQHIPLAG